MGQDQLVFLRQGLQPARYQPQVLPLVQDRHDLSAARDGVTAEGDDDSHGGLLGRVGVVGRPGEELAGELDSQGRVHTGGGAQCGQGAYRLVDLSR